MYKRLYSVLNNTRKNLREVCEELDVDIALVDPKLLNLDQCTHCSIWTNKLHTDLDNNLICNYCRHLIGL